MVASCVSEQFGVVVDPPVAVYVQSQKAVVGIHPAGALGKPINIQIEVSAGSFQCGKLNAVAFEVNDQR